MFRGQRMTQSQVSGLEAIVNRGASIMPRSHLAYILATAFHETGQKCQPVREGFAKSNSGAIRAVTGLYNKGIIRTNYAIPHSNGHSYYGRGLVQITWRENYGKMGRALGVDLTNDPDLALDPDIAIACLFVGMQNGMFVRGKSLAMIPSDKPNHLAWRRARGMINNDVTKNGARIAMYAMTFWLALEDAYADPPKLDKEEHSLWCRILDFIGLGDHSAAGL